MSDVSNPWRVKYDGACSRCGAPLLRGEPAIWERATRTIRCIECPTGGEALLDTGSAGDSARREYERRMAKRDVAAREKWGDRLGGVVLALTDAPISTRAWSIGSEGEAKLAAALSDVDGLIALHDRRVPGTRGNIDHILIAPSGVFVVDAKAHKGMVRIRDRGGLFRTDLRLYVGSRDCSGLADGLTWQVEAVRRAFDTAVLDVATSVIPVLCFVEADWPLLRAPESFRGVLLESPRSLRKLVTKTTELESETITLLARTLASALPSK
jgi:hypothetical protein